MFEIPFATCDRLAAFLLVFLRMSGLFVVAPLFSNRSFPMQVRVLGAFLIALVAFPAVAHLAPAGTFAAVFRTPYTALLGAAGELGIGWLIGMTAALIIWSGELAGHFVGQEIGYSLGDVLDPVSENQGSPTTQLFFLFALLVFIALNGHHLVLLALAKSFSAAPPGAFPFGYDDGSFLVSEGGGALWAQALQIALPVMIALFLVTVAMAILARAVPEMNVFIFGFAIRVLFGLFVLIAVLPLVADVFRGGIVLLENNLSRLLGAWEGKD